MQAGSVAEDPEERAGDPAGRASHREERRRRVRRAALFWALIAAAFYLGFIILTLVRGSK
jgi:hypothetical protein